VVGLKGKEETKGNEVKKGDRDGKKEEMTRKTREEEAANSKT